MFAERRIYGYMAYAEGDDAIVYYKKEPSFAVMKQISEVARVIKKALKQTEKYGEYRKLSK